VLLPEGDEAIQVHQLDMFVGGAGLALGFGAEAAGGDEEADVPLTPQETFELPDVKREWNEEPFPCPPLAYSVPTMKIAKALLYTLLILGALAAFGWFFVSELGSGGRRNDEPAAVLQGPPPGYDIVERGETSPTAAAAELETQALRPGAGKVGIHFAQQGAEIYWLADVQGELIEERRAGSSGTRLETVWRGAVRERLRWAREHGDFTVPGMAPPERKNLYH